MASVWQESEIMEQVQALSGLVEKLVDRIASLESFVEEIAGDVASDLEFSSGEDCGEEPAHCTCLPYEDEIAGDCYPSGLGVAS
jgi:hypothetical protein